jgi:hypothetical protein
MRYFSKRPKFIIFLGCLVFLGFYLAINYTGTLNSLNSSNIRIDRLYKKAQLYELANKQLENNPKQINKDRKNEDDNLEDDEELTGIINVKKNDSVVILGNSEENPLKSDEKKVKKRYLAYDGGGFGSVNAGVIKCASSGLEVEITSSKNRMDEFDISFFHMNAPTAHIARTNTSKTKNYIMVYTMESEVHSFGGDTWSNADFRMWYNLELSFPEPATYFDLKMHLVDLLSQPKIEFNKKYQSEAPIVWVVSNCNAYNGREKFMKSLMDKIGVDSYGGCLKNKFSHPNEHMKGNIELYSKYKFVISIENSNCEDYVTEKLVHAVASGSIPIVAGKDSQPDYSKFMPRNSYINIYDYKSIDDLVKHLKLVSSDNAEYEKYMWFKRAGNFTSNYLKSLDLKQLINVAKKVFDFDNRDKEFYNGIVSKEKSEDKLCKIVRYLQQTSESFIEKVIELKRANRPDSNQACMKRSNLANDFQI